MILNIEIIECKKFVLVKYKFSLFKTIIFECGVINVCSSSITCEIIFWMVKGVIVTKENSHATFLDFKHFYKLRGAYSSQSCYPIC